MTPKQSKEMTRIAVAACGNWSAGVGQQCADIIGDDGEYVVTGPGEAKMWHDTCAPGPFVHGYIVWPMEDGLELFVPLGPQAMCGPGVKRP